MATPRQDKGTLVQPQEKEPEEGKPRLPHGAKPRQAQQQGSPQTARQSPSWEAERRAPKHRP